MQSSACQNSGRTPSPVPQANCKPAPWSIWQMAYPSHYKKMNNCMKNNSKPTCGLSRLTNCVLNWYGNSLLMPIWLWKAHFSVHTCRWWWYWHWKLPQKTTAFISNETTIDSMWLSKKHVVHMEENQVEPTNQVTVLASINMVWRLNFQTENTRLDGEKSSLTWINCSRIMYGFSPNGNKEQHAIIEYRKT